VAGSAIDLQSAVCAMAVWHSAHVAKDADSSKENSLISRFQFATEPGNHASGAGRIAITQSNQRVCLVPWPKMHVIAQPVHWWLGDFRIPRMTGRAAREGVGVIRSGQR
jgi:hypothetical protein